MIREGKVRPRRDYGRVIRFVRFSPAARRSEFDFPALPSAGFPIAILMTLLRSVRAEQSGNRVLHAPFCRVINSESHRRKCRCLRTRSLNHLLLPSPFGGGRTLCIAELERGRGTREKSPGTFVQLFSSRPTQFRGIRYPVKSYHISRVGFAKKFGRPRAGLS